MKSKAIGGVLLIFCVLLTACSIVPVHSIIDWVDFIEWDDIQYIGIYSEVKNIDESNVGEVIGKVKFNVSENVNNPKYKVKNGDAAFLPKGTKLYKIKGYKPEFRIAVKVEGEWRIYEADTNSKAKKGGDLLDIEGKVSYIGINSETDGKTELGAIKDQTSIEKLVKMVLDAEVNQNYQNQDQERYFIEFHLSDGSSVTRCYWIASGELSRGIMLPEDFGVEIKKALIK